jgi:purine-cytosine permease-like protein
MLAFLVALGTGGKYLKDPVPLPPATGPLVLSFGAAIAGFTITYSPLSSDFTCYLLKDGPRSVLSPIEP